MATKRNSRVSVISAARSERDFEMLLRQAAAYLKTHKPRLIKAASVDSETATAQGAGSSSTGLPSRF